MNRACSASELADSVGVSVEPNTSPDRPRLSLRSPDDILAMEFSEYDSLIGDYLLAKGQSLAIVGAGGVGKTRLLLQQAVCVMTGRDFVGFPTRGREQRWLIIQGENSSRRLQTDLHNLKKWVGKDWDLVNKSLAIHTLETDYDGLLSLDIVDNRNRISELIARVRPDVVCFDTLFNFATGDLNSDRDMLSTCQAISQVARKGNPERAVVVIHHALTGRTGAGRAIGFERSGFGRNSKVLQAWTRAQINVAPGSPDNNDTLVLSCGKSSNGREFPMFAVHLNPDTMIYDVSPSFDLGAWKSEVTGKRDLLVPDGKVCELCTHEMVKSQLAKAIMEATGCQKTYAYRRISRAQAKKEIIFNSKTKTYAPK